MSLGQPICFICLKTSLEYVHLEATLSTSYGVLSYRQLLHECTDIRLDLDEYLCTSCASALETTYEFLELAKKAAHRYRSPALIEQRDYGLEWQMKHQDDDLGQLVEQDVDREQADQQDVDLGQVEHLGDGQEHLDDGQGHLDDGQGHLDDGQGHRDDGQGHLDDGQGHRDDGQGHLDDGQGHLDDGQEQTKHLDEHKEQMMVRQQKQTCDVECYEEEVTATTNETHGLSEGIPAIEQVGECERLNDEDLVEYVGDDESDDIMTKSYFDDADSCATSESSKANALKKMHKCPQCPAVFPTPSLRRKHLWLRHKSLDTCLVCISEVPEDESLASHLQQSHNHVRKCSQCDYEDRDDKVGIHERSIHLTDTLYQCSLCDEKYPYTEYATHLRSNCAKPLRKHSAACEICGKKFVSPSYLRTHMEAHAQQREEYACPDCDKRYLLKSSLDSHMRIHLGETYNCRVCHKQFVRPNELRIHMRFHNGVAPYECELCPRSFTIQSHWRSHMWSHENKKLKCDDCGKLFKSSKSLHEHSFTHTGMPFECRECGRGCSSRQKLRNHLRSVHKCEASNEEVESMKIGAEPRRKKLNVVVDTNVDGDFMEGIIANGNPDEPEEMSVMTEEDRQASDMLTSLLSQDKEEDNPYGLMVEEDLIDVGTETVGAFAPIS